MLTADDAAFDTVLEAYVMARREQPDRHLADRARLAGELALVRWLNAGLAADDAGIVDEAHLAMRDLAERIALDAAARRLTGDQRDAAAGDLERAVRPYRDRRSRPGGAGSVAWSRWTRMSLRCKRSTTSRPAPDERDQLADLVAALSSAGVAVDRSFPADAASGRPGLARSWRPATEDFVERRQRGVRDRPAVPAAGAVLALAALDRLVGAAADARADARAGRMVPVPIPDEPRAALAAVVETELGPLTVIGTHLSFLPGAHGPSAAGATPLGRDAARAAGPARRPQPARALPAHVTGWRRLADVRDLPGARTAGAAGPRARRRAGRGDPVARPVAVAGEVSDHRAVVVDLSRR